MQHQGLPAALVLGDDGTGCHEQEGAATQHEEKEWLRRTNHIFFTVSNRPPVETDRREYSQTTTSTP